MVVINKFVSLWQPRGFERHGFEEREEANISEIMLTGAQPVILMLPTPSCFSIP